jgi:calcineurin-like phosphoesterase family protein
VRADQPAGDSSPAGSGTVSRMKFRDDIDPERTWVVSDTHFGHENIKAFCHRPLDIEQTMMEEWARAVPEKDSTLLHVGDMAYRGNAWFKNMIAKHLTGERKLLIQGNHDKQRYSFFRDAGFRIVKPFAIRWENKVIQFSHYPWNAEFDDAPRIPDNTWRVHGHIHNNGSSRHEFTPYLKNHINISVEQTKYRPVRLASLLEGAILGSLREGKTDWYDGNADYEGRPGA